MDMIDAHKIVSKFGSPHARRCGAKTRSAARCRNLAVRGMKRCRMHGGKSLIGIAHPNHKHGLYSKHCLLGMMLRAEIAAERRRVRTERKINHILAQERLERERQQRVELAKMPKWNVENLMALAGRPHTSR